MTASTESPASSAVATSAPSGASVDLYWLPLGAGGNSVRFNGLVFEFVAARWQHRTPADLYHSALAVQVQSERYIIEMAPAWDELADDRGVVGEGAVASRYLGRFKLFRYEIRRWREGRIPDVSEAVDSPQRLSDDPALAQRVLQLVADVPTPVWGRDELHAGEMWNSNSVVAWVLARAGVDLRQVRLPAGGRAPGWTAGLAAARPATRTASTPGAGPRRLQHTAPQGGHVSGGAPRAKR